MHRCTATTLADLTFPKRAASYGCTMSPGWLAWLVEPSAIGRGVVG